MLSSVNTETALGEFPGAGFSFSVKSMVPATNARPFQPH